MSNGNEVERRVETAQALTQLSADVKANTEKTDKVLGLLYDNGLVTQVALNKQSLSRLWKWTGGATTAIFLWAIRGVFK